jgi:F0F1-type ATP synthase delta subunit
MELLEKNGHSQEFIQELKEGKFIIKRSKELAALIRGEIIKKQKKEKVVIAKPLKEIDHTKRLKQQINTVIRYLFIFLSIYYLAIYLAS